MPTETINAGENKVINLTVRDDLGAIIPTSEIQSLTVTLVYQACSCDEEGDVLGTWTFTGPSTYSAGMAANGDGMFKIEVLRTQTLVPGLLSLVTDLAVLDPIYFVSGALLSRTITEDVLEILEVPSIAVDGGGGATPGDTYLTPDGSNYFQPDGESLYLAA